MRSVIAFYRARPVTGAIVFLIGLAIAVATALFRDGGGVILPLALCVFAGFGVGGIVAYGQRRRDPIYDLEQQYDAPSAPEPHEPAER